MPKIAFLGFPQGKVRVKFEQQDVAIEDTIDLDGDTGGQIDPPPKPDPDPEPKPDPKPDPEDPNLQPAPAKASVQLSATRTTGVAPVGFFFSATASNFGVEDHYFDVDHKWTFDDPGHYTRQDRDTIMHDRVYDVDGTRYIVRGPVVYLEDGTTQHVAPAVLVEDEGFRPDFGTRRTYLGPDKNIAYGPHVCHVFEKPGTYTVRCETRVRGYAPVVETIAVKVENPDNVFAGSETAVVAADRNFAGKPAGAQEFRTWDDAIAWANNGAMDTSRRILFKRGQSHSKNNTDANGNHARFQVGAWGDGGDPIITDNGFSSTRHTCEFSFWGLDVQPSNYNPADPWKTSTNGAKKCFVKNGDSHVTLWDNKFHKMDYGILLGAKKLQNLVIGNHYTTDWFNYGFFGNPGAGNIGFCGYFARQNPDVVNGQGKMESKPPFYADHGPFRFAATGGPVAVNLADARSLNSWGNGHYQPCFRIGRSWNYSGPEFEEIVMDRCTGIYGSFYGTGNADSDKARPRRYLWDKCYLMAANTGGDGFINLGVSGPQVRNSIIGVGDVPADPVPGYQPKVWLMRPDAEKGAKDDASMRDFGVAIYNCNLVNRRSHIGMGWDLDRMHKGGTSRNGGSYLPFAFVRIGNNVVTSAYKGDSTDTGDAPLDGRRVWIDDYPGARDESTKVKSEYKFSNDHLALYAPQAGSSAVGAASLSHSNVGNKQGAPIAVRDFFGNLRGATTSRGAFD